MPKELKVIGNNALAPEAGGPEQELGSAATAIVQVANSTVIASQKDYEEAAGILKDVKRIQKQVKEYWEPLRVSTRKAYDGVLEKKKQMIDPLNEAESILKGLMSSYTVEQERKRAEREAAMRAAARREAERIMEQATAAEEAGDAAGAEAAMEEAMVMDEAAAAGRIMASAPKAAGVSTSKTWKIVSIDPDKVPVKVGAVEIRPVDQAAVMRLTRESKGNIEIPGVKFEESVQISVRG
jgi:hypothetical protein